MTVQVQAVQRMQEFIDSHLGEEITLADLASVSYFSPWHSYRLFCLHTGLSPASYIRKLRLSEASRRLKDKKCQVTDLAFELGFKSVDGFIRAFEHEYGISPGVYRQNHVPITLFIPYKVKFRYPKETTMSQEKVIKNVFVQVIQKHQRKVIIKRGVKASEYWDYCKEVGCDVWGLLMSMDSLCGEPVCLWLPKAYVKEGTSTYVQGIEVDCSYSGPIPEGFDVITLPECEYLMFQGEPFEEEDYCEAIEAVQNSMNKYSPSILGYKWDESNPRIQLEPRGERGYIELKAIKRA